MRNASRREPYGLGDEKYPVCLSTASGARGVLQRARRRLRSALDLRDDLVQLREELERHGANACSRIRSVAVLPLEDRSSGASFGPRSIF